MSDKIYDVGIIGGGPAGLSAALVLARALRSVLLFDTGEQRNRRARQMHGYLTRDGISPRAFLNAARRELRGYNVEMRAAEVLDIDCLPSSGRARFALFAADKERVLCRRLLLATGVRDILPPLPGLRELYGSRVHHCPYCDGWEYRGKRLCSLGTGAAAVGQAKLLRQWSKDIVVCSFDRAFSAKELLDLKRLGVNACAAPLTALRYSGRTVVLELQDGRESRCAAVFFNSDKVEHSPLPRILGCQPRRQGTVRSERHQRAPKPGVFLAGDVDGDVQFVIVAAAEGARAAVAINAELVEEDFQAQQE